MGDLKNYATQDNCRTTPHKCKKSIKIKLSKSGVHRNEKK